MSSMKIILSEKGKQLILLDGFKYRFHKMLKNGAKRWICCAQTKEKCKAYLKTEGEDNIISEIVDKHDHEKLNEEVLNRQILSNSIKRKAIEDINERPMKIVHKELRNGDIHTLTTEDVRLVKRNIYHARRSVLPVLPKSMAETHDIFKTYPIKTNKEEEFLLVNDIENQIIMFSCKTNLEFLADLDAIYIDGTFEYCPKFYLQMFSIHGLKGDHYIPLVFFLLPNKRKTTYTLALKHLIAEIGKCNKVLTLRKVFADFEEAIHQSVKEVWTDVALKGCRFHLGQSWWRKIQALGLTSLYKDNDSDVGKYLKYCYGMPFLDPSDVGDCFVEHLSSIQPQDSRIVEFADYLVNNYISESARFPPEIWAEKTSSNQRTTNACESFHSRYNSSFYSAHPNIFQFVRVLTDFQSDTYIKIRSVQKNVKKVYSAQTNQNKNFLEEQIIKLNNKLITNFDFIKIVGEKFKIHI